MRLVPSHALTLADNISGTEIDNASAEGCPSLLGVQGDMNARLLGNSADGGLLESNELGARCEDEAILSHRGVAPKLLNGALYAINWDDDIGICARLIVGELNCGSGFPRTLGGRGKGNGGEESTGKCGGVGELHFEDWLCVMVVMIDWDL